MSINRVVLVGRITEPESRQTTGGKDVTNFRIAVKKYGSDEPDWYTVVCWGNTAKFVNDYLSKGRLVAVDGRLQSRKYTTQDGSNREAVEIVADNVQGLDRPRDDQQPEQVTTEDGAFDPFADE